MSTLSWYWHRLWAMSPVEMALHVRKKFREAADQRRGFPELSGSLAGSGLFPKLPPAVSAPRPLREALQRDATRILLGRWTAFGHVELKVDDPPNWHRDYLVGRELATTASAFTLNHRALPASADIKLIWELSRWHELVRLAMAAYVLGEEKPASRCVDWLEDWSHHNPPYRGWNWTSALEVGIRLIQFTWIDALLSSSSGSGVESRLSARLEALRRRLLPAHVWYAWRHRSFGSSANNHLLGELAGLILAVARWPALARWSAPLEKLHAYWEREVLAQFAPDGGHREAALSYQLFAWELAWQTAEALNAAGRPILEPVRTRLARALRFFWEVQSRSEHWDYGDSDNASVTPFYLSAESRVREWRDWAAESSKSLALEFWLGPVPSLWPRPGVGSPAHTQEAAGWWIYPDAGLGLHESGFWWLRWDLSPLGYLRTAAHGHLDLLHLSIWFRGVAMVIDPGTGAYFADPQLRAYLASREAHNGPCSVAAPGPRRFGPFLWSEWHGAARWNAISRASLEAEGLGFCRRISRSEQPDGWQIEDRPAPGRTSRAPFTVFWQFAPGAWVKRLGPRRFSLRRADVSLVVEVGEDWAEIELVELPTERAGAGGSLPGAGTEIGPGVVSPAFRKVMRAPGLRLTARPPFSPTARFWSRFEMAP